MAAREMAFLESMIRRASNSGFHLKLLNFYLRFLIPFNGPHGVKVAQISPQKVQIRLPYITPNLNHLRGQHACALALAAELSSGILLLQHFPPSEYRLVMQKLTVEYGRQGRGNAVALSDLALQPAFDAARAELDATGRAALAMAAEVREDAAAGEELCRAELIWQLKRWDAPAPS